MKYVYLLVFAVVAFGCHSQVHQQGQILAEGVSLYIPLADDPEFIIKKITNVEALSSLQAMQDSLKNSYVGYNLKKELIGKNGDEIFELCKKPLADRTDTLTAYEIYDYALQCIALFQDSHLYIEEALNPSYITTAVSRAQLIGDKLYVTRIRPNVITKFEDLFKMSPGYLSDKIKLGAEITSINGKPVADHINDLKKFVSGSSPDAVTQETVTRLFYRSFSYPKNKNVTVKLKQADGTENEISLPWIYYSGNSSLESRTLLKEQGFINNTDLNPDSSFTYSKGQYGSENIFSSFTNFKTYEDQDGDTAMLTGHSTLEAKDICFLKLNTFMLPYDATNGYTVIEDAPTEKVTRNFISTVSDFLKSCDSTKTPLVLDLRNNGGGSIYLAEMFYLLFETSTTLKTYAARADLISSGNLAFYYSTLNTIDSSAPGVDTQLVYKVMKSAKTKVQNFSDWILYRHPTYSTGAFSQPVYLLTSDECVSACELTAKRFQEAKRATLVGTATAGTGFGFISSGKGKTQFRDPLNLFEMRIPNQMFNTLTVADDSAFEADPSYKGTTLDLASIKPMENSPTKPEIKIEYTLKDFTNNFEDYLNTLAKIVYPTTTKTNP